MIFCYSFKTKVIDEKSPIEKTYSDNFHISNEVSQTNFKSKKVFDAENFGIDQKITTEIKDGSDPCHFIFEFNVGKRRIRHKTSQKLIDEFLDRLKID